MSGNVIEIEHLTKDYGNGQGIFDISLEVTKGEVFGFIGTNGSGKTTTIRNMLGFIRPDGGSASILGMDSWKKATAIKPYVSYVPGEIAFPRLASGTEFLKLQAQYLGITGFDYMNGLIHLFQLDPSANLKRMSKGMKQKTALVAALMSDHDVLVLDEPTTGLDPLMREVFLELIRGEKEKGKTVFMSSHIFEEVEAVCDRAAMIKDGRIIDIIDVDALRNRTVKHFTVVFQHADDAAAFARQCDYACCKVDGAGCELNIDKGSVRQLIRVLSGYKLYSLSEKHETVEQLFYQAFMKGVENYAE